MQFEHRALLLETAEHLFQPLFIGAQLMQVLCCWESYNHLSIHGWQNLPESYAWLGDAMPEDNILVILRSAHDSDDSTLPELAGQRSGYLICKKIRFEEERD